MYEWVHKEKFTIDGFKSNYISDLEMVDRFELVRKITNGTKHFIPKDRTQVHTHVQGGFSSAFSDGFARPLSVEFTDGRIEQVDIFLRKMVEFSKCQQKYFSKC